MKVFSTVVLLILSVFVVSCSQNDGAQPQSSECKSIVDSIKQHRCLMLVAIRSGDVDSIADLVATPYVDLNDASGENYLVRALHVIDNGPEGDWPLAIASLNKLLELGADPNVIHDRDSNPMIYHMIQTSPFPMPKDDDWWEEMFQVLFDAGLEPNRKWSLGSSGDVSVVVEFSVLSYLGWRCSSGARHPRWERLFELALENGEDPNLQTHAGTTALMRIARDPSTNDPDICERFIDLLVDRGADLDAIDDYGRTAADMATLYSAVARPFPHFCTTDLGKAKSDELELKDNKQVILAKLIDLGATEPTVAGGLEYCRGL